MRLWKRKPKPPPSWSSWICFPADDDPFYGESAFYEIEYGDAVWAYVTLEGIDESAVGDARTEGAQVFVTFAGENDDWEEGAIKLDFGAALAQAAERLTVLPAPRPSADEARSVLENARKNLFENEQGRLPMDDLEGLSRVGYAVTRMSQDNVRDMMSDDDPPR